MPKPVKGDRQKLRDLLEEARKEVDSVRTELHKLSTRLALVTSKIIQELNPDDIPF